MILTNRYIETLLYRQAMLLWRWRIMVMIAALFVVAIFAFLLTRISIDTSIEGYLTDDDPHLTRYLQFRDQYGSDDLIIVALEAPQIFDSRTLLQLQRLHHRLADQTPYLASISSLVSVIVARSETSRIVLDTFLPEDPASWPPMAELARQAAEHPLITGRLVSSDNTQALLLLRIESKARDSFANVEETLLLSASATLSSDIQQPSSPNRALTNTQNNAVIAAVKRVVESEQQDGNRVYVCGSPILKQVFRRALMHDAVQLIILSLIVISVLLLAVFRRPAGVIFPLLIVAPAVLCSVGLMVLLQRPIKAPTVILPSFLMAMGVGASIHLLTHFFRIQPGCPSSPEAAARALARTGLPIFFTSLTTAAGLASFAGAEVGPVADLGRFGALGVMLACLFTIVLLPPLLGMLPLRPPGRHRFRQGLLVDQGLSALARFSVRRAAWIAIGSLALFIFSLLGAEQVRFSHNPLGWLPQDHPLKLGIEHLDQVMGGIINVEVLVDTKHPGGGIDPTLLQTVRTLQHDLNGTTIGTVRVASSFSLVDLLDNLATVFGTQQPTGDPRQLVAQQLLLFENVAPATLAELTDLTYQNLRLTLLCPWVDAVAYGPFIKELETLLQQRFTGVAEVTVTGMIPLLARTLDAAIHSTAFSYLIAGASITLLMVLLCGLRLGLLGMIPNLLPIAAVLGFMGWRGIPLDMYTMLAGSIAVGLAVDDTMHFLHGFHYHSRRGLSVVESATRTITAEGRAMLVTSLVLAAGALVCTLSDLKHFFLFGVLTSSAIMLALTADFLLGPAMMQLLYRGQHAPTRPDHEITPHDITHNEEQPWLH